MDDEIQRHSCLAACSRARRDSSALLPAVIKTRAYLTFIKKKSGHPCDRAIRLEKEFLASIKCTPVSSAHEGCKRSAHHYYKVQHKVNVYKVNAQPTRHTIAQHKTTPRHAVHARCLRDGHDTPENAREHARVRPPDPVGLQLLREPRARPAEQVSAVGAQVLRDLVMLPRGEG